jgi:hypothetical protein
MQGWGYQWEEDFGQKCQQWVVTRDSAGVVSMMTATLLSLKGHFCPSFTPLEKKITSSDTKIAWFNLTP